MPGLFGIKTNVQQVIYADADLMIKSLDHFNYQHTLHKQNGFFLGHVYLQHQLSYKMTGQIKGSNIIFLFHGEIFSYSDQDIPSDTNPIQFLFLKFSQEGFEFIKKINGHYHLCIYNETAEELHLVTDRYGTLPLYYTQYKTEFAFAPEVKALLVNSNIPRKIDYQTVSDLFHFNHAFGTKTLFRDIHQLPSAAHLTFKNNNYSIEHYWDFPYNDAAYANQKPVRSVVKEAEQNLGNLMAQAFNRQSKTGRNGLLIPLSGGLDSRWMVALAHETGINPIVSFTMGPKGSEDVKYAQLVAQHIGIKHKIFEMSPAEIWRDAVRFSYIGEGTHVIFGPIQNFPPYRYYDQKVKIVIMPQMCDALFGSTLYRKQLKILMKKKSWDSYTENLFIEHLNTIRDVDIYQIFQPRYSDEVAHAYRIVPQQYIERDKNPMFCYFKLFLNEYVRRGTLSGNVATNLFFNLRMPSYDNDLMDFAFNIPISLKVNQDIYRFAFALRYPELARIPRQGTNLAINASDLQLNFHNLESRVINRAKKTKLKSLIKNFHRWNRPNYVSYAEWFRSDLKKNVENLVLDPKTLDRGLFRKDGLQLLLQDHFTGRKDRNRLIWQVINLELFFRHFID
jgi:asparagine synthase (glutamine-hydrolysing)